MDVEAAFEVLAGSGESGVDLGRFFDVFIGASLAGVDVRGGTCTSSHGFVHHFRGVGEK